MDDGSVDREAETISVDADDRKSTVARLSYCLALAPFFLGDFATVSASDGRALDARGGEDTRIDSEVSRCLATALYACIGSQA
jgi:hypothetical protein